MTRLMKYAVLLGVCMAFIACSEKKQAESKVDPKSSLSILATSDLKDIQALEKMVLDETGVAIKLTFGGTMESTEKVMKGEANTDAAWFANARYLLSDPAGQSRVKLQEKIMLSPLVVGVSNSTARSLGWDTAAKVTWKDVADAAKDGKLRYTMSNPASSNQGFMAVMGVAAAFANKPEALTLEDVNKQRLADFFKGYKLVGDNSTYLTERFIERQGADLNAFINYESWLLTLNRSGKLKEPLTLIYPHEGVATADYPLMLLNDSKRDAYQKVVAYLKGDKAQRWLAQNTGRRSINPEVMKQEAKLFPGSKVLIELPFTTDRAVADALVDAYLNEFRAPIASTFVIDVSGSMNEPGRREGLLEAMHFLSGDDSSLSGRFSRLASRERVWMLPFSNEVQEPTYFEVPNDKQGKVATFQKIGAYADSLKMRGNTRLYDAVLRAIDMMAENKRKAPSYLYSVVVFTDGAVNAGVNFAAFKSAYANLPAEARAIPVFVVLYAEGNEAELRALADLTHGRAFDARSMSLVSVFKEIRSYQ